MDAAAENGSKFVSTHQIQPECGYRMSRLTRDGMAEPVSRDQVLRKRMFARLGTNYETRKQWVFAILEAMTTD